MFEAFLNIYFDDDDGLMLELQRSLHNRCKSLQSKNRSPQNFQKLAEGPSKKEKEVSYWKQ